MTSFYVAKRFNARGTLLLLALQLVFLLSVNAQTIYNWSGSSGGDWNSPENWSPNRLVPASTDILQFASGGNYVVTEVPSQTIRSLRVSNGTTVVLQAAGNNELAINGNGGAINLQVENGSSLQIGNGTNTLTLSFTTTPGQQAVIDGQLIIGTAGTVRSTIATNTIQINGGLTVGQGANFNASNTVTTVTGSVTQEGGTFTTTGSNFIVSGGAQYYHTANGGQVPTANWAASSALFITGVVNQNITGLSGQSVGSLTYNCPQQTAANIVLANTTGTTTINGDFNVLSTGEPTNALELFTTSGTLNVMGNMQIENATLNINADNSNNTINIHGDLIVGEGGTFTRTATSSTGTIEFFGVNKAFNASLGTVNTSTMQFTINAASSMKFYQNLLVTSGRTLTVNGALDLQQYIVEGAGNFTLANSAGARLATAHPAGINRQGINEGCLQNTGTRTLNSRATLVFNGTSQQTLGDWTTANPVVWGNTNTQIIIDNLAGVVLSKSLSLTGSNSAVVLENGSIYLGDYDLTLSATTSILGDFSSSRMVITNGTGSLRKTFPTGASSFLYPLGDATGTLDYSPVTYSFSSLGTSGTYGLRVVDAVHPLQTSNANTISRYWVGSGAGTSTHNLTATFQYVADDVIGSEEEFVVNHYNPTTQYWTSYPSTNDVLQVTAQAIASNNAAATLGYLQSNYEVTAGSPTKVYYRSTGNGNWNELTTWEYSTDINFANPVPVAATLIPNNTNSDGIFIQAGHTVTVSAAQTADDITVNGTLVIGSGVTMTLANGAAAIDMIVNGTLVNGNSGTSGTLTTTGALHFAAGSTYHHAMPAGTIPTATWDPNSTCLITGVTNAAPAGLNPAGGFGNVIWNAAGQTGAIATGNMTLQGSFTIQNTGTSYLAIIGGTSSATWNIAGNVNMVGGTFHAKTGTSGTATMNVTGDFNLTGGSFSLSNATTGSGVQNVYGNLNLTAGTYYITSATTSGIGTINCYGDYNHQGATLTTQGGGTGICAINLNGPATTYNYTSGTLDNARINYAVNVSGAVATLNVSISLAPSRSFSVVNGATLHCGTHIISGGSSNTFTLNAGATLGIGSPDGIMTVGNAAGNIQTTTRTFNAGARYLYNGTTAQSTGNALPATISGSGALIINNTNGVTLSQAVSITATGNGGLYINNGKLTLNDNNLTVAAGTPVEGSFSNSVHVVTNGNGYFIKTYAVGIPAFTYPIGDGTNYSPITVGFTQNGSGNLGYRVVNAAHPNNGTASDYITRYFVGTSTIATPYAYNVSFNYAADDVVGSVNNMLVSHWNGSTWTAYGTDFEGTEATCTQTLTHLNAPLANGHFTARTGVVNYYRTTMSGNWNELAVWEVSTNPSFTSAVPADDIPTVDNCAGATIVAGHTVTYNEAIQISNLDVYGTLVNETPSAATLTATGQIRFHENSVYRHNRDGGALPTALWNPASLIEVTGAITASPTNLVGQNFGNFKWNPTQEQTAVLNLYQGTTGTHSLNFAGNFEVVQTGTGALTFIAATSATMNVTIGGDFILTNGTFYMNNSTTSSVTNLYLAGSYLQTGGTFQRNNSSGTGIQVVNFNNNSTNKVFSNASGVFNTTGININVLGNAILTLNSGIEMAAGRTFAVQNGGTLYMQDNVISGEGSFSLANNASTKLGIGHANGITTSGAVGNVQVSGTRSFGANASYIYNGTVAQVTGNALPATINAAAFLQIDNTSAAGVTLSQATTINGYLELSQGKLVIGDYTLFIANTAMANPIVGAPFNANKMIVTNGIGHVVRAIPATNSLMNPYIYPIGIGNEYTPVILEFNSNTARNLGVRSVASAHPENGSVTDYINRHWTFTNNTAGTMTYRATFQYAQSDVVGDESLLAGNIYQSDEWYAHPTALNMDENVFTIPSTGYLNHSVPAVGSSLTGTAVTARNNNVNMNYHYRTVSSGNWNDVNIWEASVDPNFTNPPGVTPIAAPDYTVRTITIRNGHQVELTSDVTVDELFINDASNSKLTVNDGVTMTINSTGGNDVTLAGNDPRLVVLGTVVNNGTVSGSTVARMVVGNGATWNHARNGGVVPTATWAANSTLNITGITSTTLTGMAQPFGHVIWNCADQTLNIATLGLANTVTWAGDFRVINTGIGSVTFLNSTSALTLNIQGDLNVQGGILDMKAGSGTGAVVINIYGDLIQTGGMLTQTNTSTITVGLAGTATAYNVTGGTYNGTTFNYVVPNGANVNIATPLTVAASRSFTVNNGGVVTLNAAINAIGTVTNNGRINTQTHLIHGTGTFVQGSNATNALNAVLSLGSPDGFNVAPLASGNIQTTVRTFSNPSNYIFESTVTNTGNGFGVATSQNSLQFNGCTAVMAIGTTAVYAEYNNAVVTNEGALTLTGTTNALTLNNSVVKLGDHNLILSAQGNVINGTFGDNNMIVTNGTGRLYRQVPATASLVNPYVFPVGTEGEYSPAILSFTSNANGRLGVRVTNEAHPNADLNEAHIQRYWSFDVASGMASYAYSAQLYYREGDVVGSEGDLSPNRWNNSNWSLVSGHVDTVNNIIYTPAGGTNTQATAPLHGNDYTALGVCMPLAIVAQPVDVTTCSGNNASAVMTVGITGTSAVYQWQFSTNEGISWEDVIDNAIYSGSNSATLNIENLVAGMNGYQYRVVVQNGCSNVTSEAAVLNLVIGASAYAGSDMVVCDMDAITISDATGSSAVGFEWTHNGAGTLTNANTLTPTYTPVAADLGSVVTLTLTAQTDNACPPAVSSLSIQFNTPSTFYLDADGDGHGNPAQSIQACVAPEGYVTSNDDCDDNNANVWSPAPVVVTIDWSGSTVVCSDADPIALSGGTPAGGTWSGTSVSNNMFNPNGIALGNHTITYTVNGNGACELDGSATITLEVEECSSVVENDVAKLVVYPSFTQDKVTLKGAYMSQAVIMDSNGRIIEQFTIESSHYQLSLASYAAGIYFIQVKTANGIQTLKVIKE